MPTEAKPGLLDKLEAGVTLTLNGVPFQAIAAWVDGNMVIQIPFNEVNIKACELCEMPKLLGATIYVREKEC
jgi:hypothetical protein